MPRVLRVVCLMLIVLGLFSRPADAALWDWLEELSGFGPSHSRGNLMATIYCSDSISPRRLFKLSDPNSTDPRATCFFVDQRLFRADEDSRFYRVDTSITEFGPYVKLHPAMDVGAGFGIIHFSSTIPGGVEKTATKLTVSFPRLVFKPLRAIPVPLFQNNPNWSFFTIYFRETIIAGDLDQTDFASKPGTTFRARYERVTSMGFIIDGAALVRLIARK